MKKILKRALGAVLSVCIAAASFTSLGFQPISVQAMSGNLALNKTATASDVESGTKFTADLAVDGNTSTRWQLTPTMQVPAPSGSRLILVPPPLSIWWIFPGSSRTSFSISWKCPTTPVSGQRYLNLYVYLFTKDEKRHPLRSRNRPLSADLCNPLRQSRLEIRFDFRSGRV